MDRNVGLAKFYCGAVLWCFVLPGLAVGPRVVTTLPPIYCLTANVAGNLARVENLFSAGGSAHDFQFTVAERRKLDQADLIIANGLGLEPWLDKTIAKSKAERIVRCAASLVTGTNSTGGLTPNPHVWLDPVLACGMVTNILTALQKADPVNASAYATNAAALTMRLLKLDEEFRAGLASLPRRAIVTSHDAFPYLARRYGLEVVGVLEEHAEVDPSPAHLSALHATIQKHSVKALFVDAQENPRRVRQLARDFKVAVLVLDTLEAAQLTPSAYEDGMRRNLRALQQALK
jgi:ABC-type Zn uptake system ZnuABC Zn-binding protein ZnuA